MSRSVTVTKLLRSAMAVDYLQAILTANVYDVAIESPLDEAPILCERLDNRLLLKREDLQPVFSFKLRGAYNKMARLPAAQLARGVVTASAGNHAQGVALAAERLGVPATIVVPRTTPQIKVDAVRARGAAVKLEGDTYRRRAEALRIAKQRRTAFVHPYDDPDVIAGQGTIAMEILRQCRGPIDALFVPVGGGGLIGGIAAYVKRVRPEIRIVGVEPQDANAMERSLRAGRRVVLPHVGLFADGVAVRQVGKETFRLARKYVDEVLLVSTDEICAAIKDVFDDTRSVVEPAAALGVAGAKALRQPSPGSRVPPCSQSSRERNELRPPALRGRTGRARRAARGRLRGDDPRTARELQSVWPSRRTRRHHTQACTRTSGHQCGSASRAEPETIGCWDDAETLVLLSREPSTNRIKLTSRRSPPTGRCRRPSQILAPRGERSASAGPRPSSDRGCGPSSARRKGTQRQQGHLQA